MSHIHCRVKLRYADNVLLAVSQTPDEIRAYFKIPNGKNRVAAFMCLFISEIYAKPHWADMPSPPARFHAGGGRGGSKRKSMGV